MYSLGFVTSILLWSVRYRHLNHRDPVTKEERAIYSSHSTSLCGNAVK